MKPILKSRTIIFNLIVIAMVITMAVLRPELIAKENSEIIIALTSLLNIFFRFITSTPIKTD